MRLMSLKTLILVLLMMVLILPNAFAGDRTVVRSRGPIASAILGPKTVVRNVGSGYGTTNVQLSVQRGLSHGVPRGNVFVQQDFHHIPPQQSRVFIQRDAAVYVPQRSFVELRESRYYGAQQQFSQGYNLGTQSTLRFRDVGGCSTQSSFSQERLIEESVTRYPDGTETRVFRGIVR